MLFIVWGKLGNLIGGIDLFHMRLLHAVVGLLTIAACYALFRLLLPRNWAFLGALLVGVNHSMFMISRLAMRENTAVLVLVVALILLLWGFRQQPRARDLPRRVRRRPRVLRLLPGADRVSDLDRYS